MSCKGMLLMCYNVCVYICMYNLRRLVIMPSRSVWRGRRRRYCVHVCMYKLYQCEDCKVTSLITCPRVASEGPAYVYMSTYESGGCARDAHTCMYNKPCSIRVYKCMYMDMHAREHAYLHKTHQDVHFFATVYTTYTHTCIHIHKYTHECNYRGFWGINTTKSRRLSYGISCVTETRVRISTLYLQVHIHTRIHKNTHYQRQVLNRRYQLRSEVVYGYAL